VLIRLVGTREPRKLKDPDIGFGGTISRQLLKHLYDTYGQIEPTDLDANETRMKAAWDPPVPIERLWKQINDGKAYATAGGDALSDITTVRIGALASLRYFRLQYY
jgi:hypothetical protein